MYEPPVLLNIERLKVRQAANRAPPELMLMREFGALTPKDFDLAALDMIQSTLSANSQFLRAWRIAVAEEILLLVSEGQPVDPAVIALFSAVPLFEKNVRLSDCLGKESAVGVFPLGGGDIPGVGHVWVIKGLDYREDIQGWVVFLMATAWAVWPVIPGRKAPGNWPDAWPCTCSLRQNAHHHCVVRSPENGS